MSDPGPFVPRKRSGGAFWLLALVGALLVTVGGVVVLGYRAVRSAVGERRQQAATVSEATVTPSPPKPSPSATPAARPATPPQAQPTAPPATPPPRVAVTPRPAPPQPGIPQPRYGPADARATAQDAYRALLDGLQRGDAATVAKYELKAKLARQTTTGELFREMSGSLPFDEARIARSKTRGERAYVIADVVAKLVTDEKGKPAPIQVVARMVKEDGYWKLFRQTWLISTPLGPHEHAAADWLEEKPVAAAGKAGDARRQLEARGVTYDATNFQFAVAKNDVEQAKLFLQAGMSAATRMQNGDESLFSLALMGLQGSTTGDELVLAMIQSGSAPLEEKTPTGMTPIARAALSCRPKVVEALLRAGANPSAKDNDGRTPLQWAQQMCPAAVKPLRDAGAR